jgi:hypothetical protein
MTTMKCGHEYMAPEIPMGADDCVYCLREALAKFDLQNGQMREALKKIENLDHDEQCMSDQGSRDGDCMDDHRCYCAARIARKALSES